MAALGNIFEHLLDRDNATVTIVVGAILILVASLAFLLGQNDGGPPWLGETVPFVSNTIQMSADPVKFWDRAAKTMEALNTNILRFRLVGKTTYLVTGETATGPLFRHNSGLSSDHFAKLFGRVMFGGTEKDHAIISADFTGRAKEPNPGTDATTTQRFFHPWHTIFAEHLLRTKPTNDLTAHYLSNLTKTITTLFPSSSTWHTMTIWSFLRRHQTEAAARALHGDLILDSNPGFLDLLEEFEMALVPLTFGPPRWTGLNRKHHAVSDKYMATIRAFFHRVLATYDWDATAHLLWEPVLGGRLIRSLVRWMLDDGYDMDTIAGASAIQLSNQNSNSVPASAWAIMDALVCEDETLLPNLMREADECLVDGTFDVQKLVTQPFHQTVYTETLRLRMGFAPTRNADRDAEIDGYKIAKGAMVQAPAPIAHYAKVWEVPGHGADRFWPRRHLKEDDGGRVVFSMGERRGNWFFPYGGGIAICPGRNFAKQEIIVTLAFFLTMFEVEVVGWVTKNGDKSERRAQNEVGMALFRPDRDLKVKIRRKV